MDRATIIAGNWKMHKTGAEAEEFVRALTAFSWAPSVRVLIAPPFTALERAAKASLTGRIEIGAQNIHEEMEGAFTGEVSARMAQEAGASFVIVGHSERRRLFHETDAIVHKKLERAFSTNLLPILCIGETEQERNGGKTLAVLSRQIEQALMGISPREIVLAYEPVWAIGTGKTATPEMAEEAHLACRSFLAGVWGEDFAQKTSILYGGSVTPETAPDLLRQSDIDGALVGGASLHLEKFRHIIQGVSS